MCVSLCGVCLFSPYCMVFLQRLQVPLIAQRYVVGFSGMSSCFWCDVSVQEYVSPAKARQCIQDWYCLASSAAGNRSGQLKPWSGESNSSQGWIDPFNSRSIVTSFEIRWFSFGGQKYAVEIKLQLTYGCISFWSMSFHIKSQFPMDNFWTTLSEDFPY